MTRVFWLVLIAAVSACAPRPDAAPASTAALQPVAAPTVAVLRDGTRGGLLVVTFRAKRAVSLSATHGARIQLSGASVDAPLHAGPATQREGTNRVVTQATYRLDAAGAVALAKAGREAQLLLTLNGVEEAYPFVRADLME